MVSTTQGLAYEQTLGYDLNPAQQLVVPHLDEEKNLLISFPTSAGKTLTINMVAYKYLYGNPRKRLMYVAPMKALVEEKKRDWTEESHPYNQFNLVIVTGDYVGTWEDEKTVAEADIIVITPESLASRLRNIEAAKSKLLENIGLLVIDEVHLLDEEGRGATLEAALLEFTTENPNVPILALSATVPKQSPFRNHRVRLATY
jgi:replicative superfamily II helicase